GYRSRSLNAPLLMARNVASGPSFLNFSCTRRTIATASSRVPNGAAPGGAAVAGDTDGARDVAIDRIATIITARNMNSPRVRVKNQNLRLENDPQGRPEDVAPQAAGQRLSCVRANASIS